MMMVDNHGEGIPIGGDFQQPIRTEQGKVWIDTPIIMMYRKTRMARSGQPDAGRSANITERKKTGMDGKIVSWAVYGKRFLCIA